MQVSTEIRYCLNCSNVGPITIHGKCSTCDSEAVVLPNCANWFEVAKQTEVHELRMLWEKE